MTVRMSESGVGVLGRGGHNMGLRDDFEMDRNNVGMGVNFGADEMSSVITSLSNSVTNSNSTKNSKSRTTNDPYSEHHHQRLSSSDHDLDRGRDRDRDREMLPPVKFNMLGQMQMRKPKPLPMSTTPDNTSVNTNTNYSIKKSRSNSTLPVASPTTSTSSVVVSGGGGGVLNSQSTSDDEHLEINSGSSRISSQSEQCNKTRHNKKSVKVQGNKGKESSGSHKHHRKSPLFNNKPYQNHAKLINQVQIEENSDSPLDFSTKKIKLEIPDPSNNINNYSSRYQHLNNRDQDPRIKEDVEEEIDEEQEEEDTSPATVNNICGSKSRLRNMLSMKTPPMYENMPGTILNLSKADSPTSGRHARTGSGTGAAHTSWLLSPTRSGSRGSSSCGSNSSSPGLESQHQQLQLLQLQQQQQIQMQLHANNYILSPRSSGSAGSAGSGSGSGGASNNDIGVGGVNGSAIPSLNAAAAAALGPSQAALSVTTASSGLHHPMSYSPYGSVFGPGLSPVMNQTVPSGASLPLSFDTSPPIFSHHITASSASPNLPFGTQGLSANPPTSLSGVGTNVTISHSSSKARTTRPFKAYPKDPMSFSAVGLYGLPIGTSPTSTEAMILQQSNVAYNEFRNQMLSQSQSGKSRRGGQRSVNGLSDSMISSPNDSINFGLGAVPMDCGNNSSAEESHSAPEDGISKGCGGSSLGKTEQQLKDEAYWERRRKNNEAAKRSRDARRAKEDEIAIRAAFLEQENLKLRFELCALKNETAKLRCMLYSS